MQIENDIPTLTLNTKPVDSGSWEYLWQPNVPYTTTDGVYFYGFRTEIQTRRVGKDKYYYYWFTQEINTDPQGSIIEMGPELQKESWANPYNTSILLGGTDKPQWAGYNKDQYHAFIQSFNNNGLMGPELSNQTLQDSQGPIKDGQYLVPIISNVPNQLVDYVALIGYSPAGIYIFEYNHNTTLFDLQYELTYPGGSTSCAYQIDGKGIIIIQSTNAANDGSNPAYVFTSPTAGGPYTQQQNITFPRSYYMLMPVINQGEMFLFCVTPSNNDNIAEYDILYLDPAQGGMPSGPVDTGMLTHNYQTGFIGYDLNNKPFTYMQADDHTWVIYYFETGTAPPPPGEARPVPPSVDGFINTQVWGTATPKSYVTVTITQPGGSPQIYPAVQVGDNGSWLVALNPTVPTKTIASATASSVSGGTASDPFVRQLGQANVGLLELASVGETSISGSAGTTGQNILAWRSSDGAKMLDLMLDTDQSSFNSNYINGLTLADNDLIYAVSADPDSGGAMTPYDTKPEGYGT